MQQNRPLNELTLDELLQKSRKILDDMKLAQDKLAHASVIGVAGNEEVQIKINGKYQAISTTIADATYANKERLASLITIAINDAMGKLEKIAKE